MQNINGQMVDVDAIERLRDHFDRELDQEEGEYYDEEEDF